MSNIKVNIVNSDGKRTSTTINKQIAEVYYSTLDSVCRKRCNYSVTDALNEFISIGAYCCKSKQQIEHNLLVEIFNHSPNFFLERWS